MIYISFFVFFITQLNQVSDTLEPSYGTLIISSTPPEAEVYINNILRGTTPITIDDIIIGKKYKLRIKKEGYELYQDTILFQTPIIREKEIVLLEKKFKELLEKDKICTQAKEDAREDINSALWMGIGCLLSSLGIGAGYIYQPEPPQERLVEIPPEHIDYYTKCYKEAGRDIRTKNAGIGCLIGTFVSLLPCLFPILIPR